MATGSQRREGTPDSLVGATGITPVEVQTPQLAIPNSAVPDVINSASSQMMRSVSKWAGSRIQEYANKQHEASVLDGQMAYQQGKAMEDLDMGGGLFGDKWAMQGYRVMQAQTTASTMLAAQQEMIRQSQYEQDPESFRATYVNRMEQQLEGMDPHTAKMVREQMAEHMPTLVSQHTSAYMQNEEQNAFDTLSASIDVMSKDTTAFDNLISNAIGGEGSASAGLSKDRTRTAVVAGTVAAFNNGNPVAYHQLKSSGLLDDLPDAERQAIKAAKKKYENEVRTTHNAERDEAHVEFRRDLAAGKADLEDFIAIEARFGLNTTSAQAQAVMAGSKAAGDLGERADVIALQTAAARNDYTAMATMTQDIVMYHESRGNLNAVGPVIEGGANAGDRAQGGMQVMPKTMADPGFGIRPSDGSQADTLRVGREYWAAMVKRYKGNIEAAAIGYNAGPANADKWVAAGGDYSVLPDRKQTEPYAKSIAKAAAGEDLYYTNAERFSMAKTELQTAQDLRDSVLEAENEAVVLKSTDAYNLAMTAANSQLKNGMMSKKEYIDTSNQLLSQHNLELTSAISNGRVSAVTIAINAAQSRAERDLNDAESDAAEAKATERLDNIAKFKTDKAALTNLFENELARDGVTAKEIQDAEKLYLQEVAKAGLRHGLVLADTGYHTAVKTATDGSRKARETLAENQRDQELIDHAQATGTVGDLPKELQDKAFEQSDEKVLADVEKAKATGALKPEHAGLAAQKALLGTYIQSGTVPEKVKNHASAVMSRELTDKDGNPDPEQLAVIQQWHTLRETNPEVARTMLDEAGRIRAEAVLEMAGGEFSSPDAIQQAMVAAQRAIDGNSALVTGVPALDSQNLRNASQKAADRFMGEEGFGWVQGMFSSNTDIMQTFSRTSSEEDTLFSDEAKSMLGDRVAQEAVRLSNVSPGQTPEFYAKMAASNIGERTALVGGSLLVMDRGYSLAEQMFGDAASDMTKSGVENEVILSAIIDLAVTNPEIYGFATDTTASEQLGVLSGAVWGAGDAIASLWGGEVKGNAISGEDARQSFMRGVRPYVVETYDNQKVGIRILRPDGNYSAPLPIDLGEAGAKYRKAHIDSLIGE